VRRTGAEKDTRHITTAETANKGAAVAARAAHVAPEKVPAKKGGSQKKGAPKVKKGAKGAKAKAGAKGGKKAAKPERKAAAPRAESKGAKILTLDPAASRRHARRDYESHWVASALGARLHLDRWQEARRQDRVGEERSG